MLNVALNPFPQIDYEPGNITYEASEKDFTIYGYPYSIDFINLFKTEDPQSKFTIHATVDEDGNLVNGSFFLVGEITIDGTTYTSTSSSDPLLSGDVVQFGFENDVVSTIENTYYDEFDFVVANVWGQLAIASLFDQDYIGITAASSDSTFNGGFGGDFNCNIVKGFVGTTAQPLQTPGHPHRKIC